MNNDKADFTQGSILKKLIAFMIPVLGALILQAAYGAVDLLVVGRFGSTSGLSAVSTGSQVLNLVTFVVIQFAMGITVLIARYLGEKKPQQIGAVVGGASIVFTIISAVLFVVMVFFARPIAILMQAPEAAVDQTASYIRICGGGIFFIVAYNLLSSIFRGLGDSQSPLLFVLVACIVNVIGDLALVAGLHMDAAGAAIATVSAQALSVIFAIILLIYDHPARFPLQHPVSEISFHRTAAGASGIFNPAFLLSPVRLCQSTGTGSVLRLRCSMQNRQFRHACPERPDAVDGFLRLPKRGGRESQTCQAHPFYGNRRRSVRRLYRLYPGSPKRRCPVRLLLDGCGGHPEQL